MHWATPAGTEGHQERLKGGDCLGFAPWRCSKVRLVPKRDNSHLAIYSPSIYSGLTVTLTGHLYYINKQSVVLKMKIFSISNYKFNIKRKITHPKSAHGSINGIESQCFVLIQITNFFKLHKNIRKNCNPLLYQQNSLPDFPPFSIPLFGRV